MLSQADVDRFRERGFLKGGLVLDAERVERLRHELARVIADHGRPGQPQPVRIVNLSGHAHAPVWQVVNVWEASSAFRELIAEPRIVEEVGQLAQAEELAVWHDQIQHKPSLHGGITRWHQDGPIWRILAPADIVTAWVALDDVDVGNGCMSMVPGSHRWGDASAFLRSLTGFELPERWDGHQIAVETCPVRAGEVHYHHAFTWHGSHANTSARERRAIAVHYLDERTRFVAAGEHTMKPLVEVGDGEVLRGAHFPTVWRRGQ